MSKALDWVHGMQAAEAAMEQAREMNPGPFSLRLSHAELVRASGLLDEVPELRIDLKPSNGTVELRADEAVAFARWIIDTFAEVKP